MFYPTEYSMYISMNTHTFALGLNVYTILSISISLVGL